MIDYSTPSPGMRVAIIGDGAWGTAIALLLREKYFDVHVWGAFPEYTRELTVTRQNYKYLPGVPLPGDLVFTNDLETALHSARLAVMALPSHVMRDVAKRVKAALHEPVPFISVAKGLEAGSLKRMSQVIQEETGLPQVAALSGPSHAEEVARKMPTAVAVAGNQESLAGFAQEVFSCDYFRVYTNPDIVGVEICAALKNIIAIGAGAVDGCGFGDNAKSALLTRALVELARFATAMGGQVETIFGLAGVGDLITTCFSKHSRNRAFGERIAQGMSIEDALHASVGVVEGYRNAKIIHEMARSLGIDMPVTSAIQSVLHEGKDIRAAVRDLMTRERKSERPAGNPLKKLIRHLWLRTRVQLMIEQ